MRYHTSRFLSSESNRFCNDDLLGKEDDSFLEEIEEQFEDTNADVINIEIELTKLAEELLETDSLS